MLSLQTSAQPVPVDTPEYRPAIHFSPQRHWMNDPNGLVYADGVYHLFFQHYPEDRIWGPMHWGHATSRDLVHWDEQPIALFPDALGMIFSGSIVIDQSNTSGLGTADNAPWIALFTHHDLAAEKAGSLTYQYQSLAYSLDQGRSWTKYAGNPVLPNPGMKNFRDPKLFWHSETGRWIMVLAAGDRILFYASPNLLQWTLESEWAGITVGEGNVLECPDLVALECDGRRRWILLVSVFTGAPNGGSGTRYIVGDFDGHRFVADHDDARWLDYGPDNYAGVTFHNTGDKALLIGWMSNWLYAQMVPTAPWRSAMTLARELGLVHRDGQAVLTQKAVLARDGNMLSDGGWNDAITPLWRQQAGVLRLRLTAGNAASFALSLSNGVGEQLVIGFDAKTGDYYIDRRRAGLSDFNDCFAQKATAPRQIGRVGTDVELIFDRGSVELFADGGTTALTALFFPSTSYDRVELESDEPARNGRLTLYGINR